MLKILAITLLALAIVVTAAAAQTATTQPAPSTSTSNQGAFDKLSPGNQKIARALYEAQQINPLSLDDIAAMKQAGKGWGVVFKDMKANGQIPPDAKNLGQLVSGKYPPQATNGSTTITSASGKSQTTGRFGKVHFDDGSPGGTQGSSGVSSGSGKGYGNSSSSGPGASSVPGGTGSHGVGPGR